MITQGTMNWRNLKLNKCAKCGKDLAKATYHMGMIECDCGFRISNERFKEIVNDQVKNQIARDEAEMQKERDTWW